MSTAPAVFPGIVHLPVRQGSDYEQQWTWYTDAPREAIFRGDWDEARIYARHSLVRYSGDLYAALERTEGDQPDTSADQWRALSAQSLVGYSARLQVRDGLGSTHAIIGLNAVSAAPGGSIITLGGAAGTVTVSFRAADTEDFPVGTHVYDLELVSGAGRVTPFLAGEVRVAGQVTR